jgi:hypothetical protein
MMESHTLQKVGEPCASGVAILEIYAARYWDGGKPRVTGVVMFTIFFFPLLLAELCVGTFSTRYHNSRKM